MRIVRLADRPRVPWKNGAGTAVELAAGGAATGPDAFDWRFSLADIESPTAFSRFDGVDRSLTLVEGRKLDLTVDGVRHELRSGDTLAFSGEAAVRNSGADGPVRVFNVMTRRAALAHDVTLVTAGRFALPQGGAVLAYPAAATLEVGGSVQRLDALDLLLAETTAVGGVDGPCLVVAFNAPPVPHPRS